MRARVISLRLAVAVAVIGAVGPFVGSCEFVREERRGQQTLRRHDPHRCLRASAGSQPMAVNTTVQVTLPQMGESVTEGTVLEWHKQEGDTVEADETLVEISTDKVDAEVPAPATGTVVKIHAAEGDTVRSAPCSPRSRPATAPARRASPRHGSRGGSRPGDRRGAGRAEPSGTGEIVDIVTPAGGESVTEGTILEWAVKVGDAVEDGQTVVEISTDKVDMELPAPAAGTITEILAEEGETVTVGQVIARMQAATGAAARRQPRRRRRRRASDGARRAGAAPPSPTTRRSPRSPRASPPPRASTSPASAAPARAGGSRRPTSSPRRTATHRRQAAPARRPRRGERRAAQGRRGDARPLHGREPLDPDGDLVPHDHRHGDGHAAASSSRTAGQKVSFTHLIAYAIARPASTTCR